MIKTLISFIRNIIICCILINLDKVKNGIVMVKSQNLQPFAKEIGGTFCKFLAMKSQLPRNYLNDCDDPTCNWDTWNTALHQSEEKKVKERIVLSYAHNGFGNQLWQHTIAFMIAESLKAKLYIAIIPDDLCLDGYIPPNTYAGTHAMEALLPDEFEFEKLPKNSRYRQICNSERFYISDRPREWRDKNYTGHFKTDLYNILNDNKPRCIKMLGYFQNLPLCAEDAKKLWTPKMFSNFTMKPGDNDISIYLRCLPRHYHFNDKHYYETILNGTNYDRIWLFQAPDCPTRITGNPARDGLVPGVIRMLRDKYNATRWPSFAGNQDDDTSMLLHDLSALAQSKKLILPVSSWAHWAGLLSNAVEVHVNGPPHSIALPDSPQYIYHSEKSRLFFGRYNHTTKDIEYEFENPYRDIIL